MSIRAADSLPAGAVAQLSDVEPMKREPALLDKQAQPRQEKSTLLMQLQQLQQELGLQSPNSHPQVPDTVGGTDLASALDSLAAAAAAAATESSRHAQQQPQQHMRYVQAAELRPVDTAHHKLPTTTSNPELDQQTDTMHSVHQRPSKQVETNNRASVAGPVPAVQLTPAGSTGGDQLGTVAAGTAVNAGVPASQGMVTVPRQQRQGGSFGSNSLAAQQAPLSNSSALSQQRKRARIHEAHAHQFQIAKKFQQQYRQQLQQQGQGQQHPEHQQDSVLPSQTPTQPKPRPESLQQVLQQQVQQLLLPELNRQAILQSLDPTTQCMVECGCATGIFSVDSERICCLCNTCAQNQEQHKPEFAPSEFERHGGMAACKKWRFSIKVADGGPGMTLGRWLDMRGIQISSYPTKFKHPVARSKRPLESGRALGGVQSEATPSSQSDLAQLLAGLTDSSSNQTTGALKATIGSSTASAVAAVFQVLADKASNNGAATAGSNDTLKQLAAAVAELLAKELPTAAVSAAAVTAPQQQEPAAAAAGVDVPIAAVVGASLSAPNAADEPSVSTCMWPDTAIVDAGDVPVGYAVAAQAAAAAAAADSPEKRHRAALHNRHSLQSPFFVGRGSTQSEPEPHQQPPQLGMVPSRSSVSTPLHMPALASWGNAGLQGTQQRSIQQQQHVVNMAPPVTAGRHSTALPATATGSGAVLEPGLSLISSNGIGAAVGCRDSGEARSELAPPSQSAAGQPMHRSPRRAAPSPGPGALIGPNHPQQQQHRQQLMQLQQRASLGTQNGLTPGTAAGSPRTAALRPSHSADGGAAVVIEAPAAAAASSADWGKIVGSLESRLDVLLEDRKRRLALEDQVASLTDQLVMMQQQLTQEHRLSSVAEQQLASLSALLMHKLDARLDDGAARQQMVAANGTDAGMPVPSAQGGIGGECALTIEAALPAVAVDAAHGVEARQHSEEVGEGAEAVINSGAPDLVKSETFGSERGVGNGVNTPKDGDLDGRLAVSKQESCDGDGDAAIDEAAAMPVEQHVLAGPAEEVV